MTQTEENKWYVGMDGPCRGRPWEANEIKHAGNSARRGNTCIVDMTAHGAMTTHRLINEKETGRREVTGWVNEDETN